MKLPKDGDIVTISGIDYTIRYVKDLKNKKGDRLWGYYRAPMREIQIELDQPDTHKINTLLHEMVHGILEHAGQVIKNEEGVANAISYGLETVRINGKRMFP